MRRRRVSLTAWFVAAVFVAGSGAVYSRARQTARDVDKVEAMTARMKTVCVGRLLIDVPDAARVTYGQARVAGFEIKRTEETADEFKAWLETRAAELNASPNRLGQKNVESIEAVEQNGFIGRVLVHSRYRSHEVENGERKYYETVSIEAEIHRKGVTFSLHSEGDSPNRASAATALLTKLVNRSNNEVPRSPGFCFHQGDLSGPGDKEHVESIPLFIKLPGHPDVVMAFSSNSGASAGAGLVERSNAARDDMPLMRVQSRVLREGTRQLNGLAGEEFGLRVTELNMASGYGFAWEMQGKAGDQSLPSLSFELRSGVSPSAGGSPVDSSLGEEAMLKLWDKISSSIRLRAQHE